MFNNIVNYFRFSGAYLARIFIFYVIPLALFFQYSTYPLPNIQFVFLISLFVFEYSLYKEKQHRKKITPKVTKYLEGKLGRIPSRKETLITLNSVVFCRSVSIIIAAIAILFVIIFFGKV